MRVRRRDDRARLHRGRGAPGARADRLSRQLLGVARDDHDEGRAAPAGLHDRPERAGHRLRRGRQAAQGDPRDGGRLATAGDLRLRDLRHRHDRRGHPRRLPRGRSRAGAPGDPGGRAGLRRPEEPRQPRGRRSPARAGDRHGRTGRRRAARGEPGRRVQHRRRPGPDRAAARARRLHRARPPHRQRHLRGDPRRAPGAPERRRLRPGADQRRPRDAAALGRAVRRGLVLRPDRDRPVAARDGGGARRARPAAAGARRGAHRRGGSAPRGATGPLRLPGRQEGRPLHRRRQELVVHLGAAGPGADARRGRHEEVDLRGRAEDARDPRARRAAAREHVAGEDPLPDVRERRRHPRRRRTQPVPGDQGGVPLHRRQPGAAHRLRRLRGSREPGAADDRGDRVLPHRPRRRRSAVPARHDSRAGGPRPSTRCATPPPSAP